MSAPSALVTGATGGLGLALTEALAAHGYRVRATGRDERVALRLKALGAEVRLADLTRADDLKDLLTGVETVFHCAGLSSPWGRWAEFHAANVVATERLLKAARAAGCARFVFTSTPSVYVAAHDRLGLTEESPVARPFANAYAATKHAAEQRVLAAAGPDFFCSAIRPRALLGPDDKVLAPRIVRIARRGSFPLLRGGRALIEPTDVRDAAIAHIRADQAGVRASGRVYNISGGEAVTVKALATAVFDAIGLAPRFRRAPLGIAMATARTLEVLCAALPGRPEPPVTTYSLKTLAWSQTFDLSRARNELGWAPEHSWRDGLARAAEALRHA